MGYDLWDISTGNLIYYSDAKDEALAFVREAIATYGRWYVTDWALQHVDADGTIHVVARGTALAARAAKTVPA
jgi:hypothetical protein